MLEHIYYGAAIYLPIIVIIIIIISLHYRTSAKSKLVKADQKASSIIDDAIKAAESKKKEGLLELKEESIKLKSQLDKEMNKRRSELQQFEKRLQTKEEALDKKLDTLERKEQSYSDKEEALKKKSEEIDKLHEESKIELENIAGLTSTQAKEYLLKTIEEEVKHEKALLIKELDIRAKDEAMKKAREYTITAIQRCALDHISEATISVVELPSEDMKGRIIGREGRNIRTFENLSGVDVVIDDTPEAVILSCFDPIRKEVARMALEKLILDGRIHPGRIEETLEKCRKELDNIVKEAGENAIFELGLHGVHPELVKTLGKLKYRTSFGQNVLKHSVEVAHLAGLLAAETGQDVKLAKRAGLFHDIGKAIDHEMEGSHVELGADLCRRYKENAVVINSIESHHGDVDPTSFIAILVATADAISATRTGARRDSLENYTNRLKQLEEITNSFEGVHKSYALQAGREIRIMVSPQKVSDDDMVLLARDISTKIQEELNYPGMIKVNVIRESRAVEYAK